MNQWINTWMNSSIHPVSHQTISQPIMSWMEMGGVQFIWLDNGQQAFWMKLLASVGEVALDFSSRLLHISDFLQTAAFGTCLGRIFYGLYIKRKPCPQVHVGGGCSVEFILPSCNIVMVTVVEKAISWVKLWQAIWIIFWYTASNVILVDEKLTLFHQYRIYSHNCGTIVFCIASVII